MSHQPEPEPLPGDDAAQEQRLLADLSALPGAVVAFSGGVDSSYLLHSAVAALGSARVRAVFGVSPSVPEVQRAQARDVSRLLSISLVTIETDETSHPGYQANLGNRCYFCKDTLFRAIRGAEVPPGWVLMDGTNADDVQGHRPGGVAAREQGVRSPLLEHGFTKAAIRRLSRRARLPTADLPASPCLASRFPAGVAVTLEGLAQVEAAEAMLSELGFRGFRVRHHGEQARIEVDPEQLPILVRPEVRAAVTRRLHEIGYRFVSVDLDGFRSGSGSTLSSPTG